jgi:hypothetical protein
MIMLIPKLKIVFVLKVVLMLRLMLGLVPVLVLGLMPPLGSGRLIFLPLVGFGDLGRGPYIWHGLGICSVSVIVLGTTLVLNTIDV